MERWGESAPRNDESKDQELPEQHWRAGQGKEERSDTDVLEMCAESRAGGRLRDEGGGGVRSDRAAGQSQRIRTLRQQTFECCHKTVLHYKVCSVHAR